MLVKLKLQIIIYALLPRKSLHCSEILMAMKKGNSILSLENTGKGELAPIGHKIQECNKEFLFEFGNPSEVNIREK